MPDPNANLVNNVPFFVPSPSMMKVLLAEKIREELNLQEQSEKGS